MAGETALALAAGEVVDQRDARSVRPQRDDFVAEHRPGGRDADLLDVRAAEPAREHAHRLGRRGRVREAGLSVCVEHDRAHVRIVWIASPSDETPPATRSPRSGLHALDRLERLVRVRPRDGLRRRRLAGLRHLPEPALPRPRRPGRVPAAAPLRAARRRTRRPAAAKADLHGLARRRRGDHDAPARRQHQRRRPALALSRPLVRERLLGRGRQSRDPVDDADARAVRAAAERDRAPLHGLAGRRGRGTGDRRTALRARAGGRLRHVARC